MNNNIEEDYREYVCCFAFCIDYKKMSYEYFKNIAEERLHLLTLENAKRLINIYSIEYSKEIEDSYIDDNDLFNLHDYENFSILRSTSSIIKEAIDVISMLMYQDKIPYFECPLGGTILVASDAMIKDGYKSIIGSRSYYLGILEESRILRKVDKDA